MGKLNLKQYGVQKIQVVEMKEIDGGFFGVDDFLLAVAAGAVLAVINDWDNFERGLSGRPYKK